MGNNNHGVSPKKKYKGPHKTAKRLEAKKLMLAEKAAKKGGKKK